MEKFEDLGIFFDKLGIKLIEKKPIQITPYTIKKFYKMLSKQNEHKTHIVIYSKEYTCQLQRLIMWLEYKNNNILNYCNIEANYKIDNLLNNLLTNASNCPMLHMDNEYTIMYDEILYTIKSCYVYEGATSSHSMYSMYVIFSQDLLKIEKFLNNITKISYTLKSNNQKPKFVKPILLFGSEINSIINTINKDIKFYNDNFNKLEQLNMTTGLNYLIYGPSGNGKTSLVSNIANSNMLDIHNVKISNITDENMISALNGDNTTNIISVIREKDENNNIGKIILIENFDKYLETDNHSILNALDNLVPIDNIIRIFTVNIKDKIDNLPLTSRFKRIFYISNPELNTIKEIIENIYNLFNIKATTEQIHDLALLFKNNDMNCRNIKRYITRYLSEEEPIEKSILNFKDYLKELVLENNKSRSDSNSLYI